MVLKSLHVYHNDLQHGSYQTDSHLSMKGKLASWEGMAGRQTGLRRGKVIMCRGLLKLMSSEGNKGLKNDCMVDWASRARQHCHRAQLASRKNPNYTLLHSMQCRPNSNIESRHCSMTAD